MSFTFCIIFSMAGAMFSLITKAEEIKFQSPDLQKLHAVVKHIKAVPLMNMEICKLKLDKEVITEEAQVQPEVKINDELIDKLKAQVSKKENVSIGNVHTLPELYNNTNFSSFSGVLDNTFCFVNLPQGQIGDHQDRVKLFEAIKEVSENINFAVLLDDGIDQGTNVTKLYVYGVDSVSKEAYAIKADVE
jgi:hypothetical protein